MTKHKLCALLLLSTTSTAMASQFTYLSGGIAVGRSGYASKINEQIKKDFGKNYPKPMKPFGAGFYLNGSLGFDNGLFIEARNSKIKNNENYLLGLGYHYPVSAQIDLYGLVGISKQSQLLPKITGSPLIAPQIIAGTLQRAVRGQAATQHIANVYRQYQERSANKNINSQYNDRIRPTVEVGLKACLTDEIGMSAAYRLSKFGDQTIFVNESNNLHEGRLGSHYKLTDQLAVEATYIYTHYGQEKFTEKSLSDHTAQLGIRYIF